MARDSRVPEHLDTKSAADLKSASSKHSRSIFVKWRPFGSPNNQRAEEWIPSSMLRKSRHPVSLGEVGGTVPLPTPGSQSRKARIVRSSRRGKEHWRLMASESGR